MQPPPRCAAAAPRGLPVNLRACWSHRSRSLSSTPNRFEAPQQLGVTVRCRSEFGSVFALDSVLVRGTAWRCRALPPEDGHLSFWSSQLTIRRLRVSPARPHTQRHCGCSALSSHVCVQPGVFGASGVRALIAIDYSFRTSSKCSFDNTCDVCKSNARQSTHPQPWLAKRIIPVHG